MEYFSEDTIPASGTGTPAIRTARAASRARALLSALVDRLDDAMLRAKLLSHLRRYNLPESVWLPLFPAD